MNSKFRSGGTALRIIIIAVLSFFIWGNCSDDRGNTVSSSNPDKAQPSTEVAVIQ